MNFVEKGKSCFGVEEIRRGNGRGLNLGEVIELEF